MTRLTTIACIFLLLPTVATAQRSFSDFVSTVQSLPQCVRFPIEMTLQGDAEFVDVDNSGTTVTTGDYSISTNLIPNVVLPIEQGQFLRIDALAVQAICLVTMDQAPPTVVTTPTCDLEIELAFTMAPSGNFGLETYSFSGKLLATGTGPQPFGIIGGTSAFVGASGEIITNGSFNIDESALGNGAMSLSFDANLFVCVYMGINPSQSS